jgi:uncharacterized membrane protein
VLLNLLYVVVVFVLSLVPVLGAAATAIISPALYAGMLAAARDTAGGSGTSFGQLFAPLLNPAQRNPLLVLGALFLGAEIVAMLLVVAVAGAGVAVLFGIGSGSPAGAVAAGPMVIGVLLGLTVMLVAVMGIIYAVPLVAFAGMPPTEALKSSFMACIVNLAPMTVAGLALIVLTIIAIIPFGLGLLILGPVTFCALWASYRDLYPDAGGAQLEHHG